MFKRWSRITKRSRFIDWILLFWIIISIIWAVDLIDNTYHLYKAGKDYCYSTLECKHKTLDWNIKNSTFIGTCNCIDINISNSITMNKNISWW